MNSRELEENCESSDVGDFVDTLDELIIACVQSYPHLYNKSNANYKDHMMKQKSWEEIAQTCNISDIEVQQRWKRLKDRFSKQRRLNDYATRSGSAAQTIKQWPLYENMKFMEKHIQKRRTFSNVSLQSIKGDKNTLKELNLGYQNESRTSIPAFQSSQNITQIKQELKKIQSTCTESNQLKNEAQKMLPKNQLEKSTHALSRGWQNVKPTITNTFTSSMGMQASMSLKPANTFDAHLRERHSPRFTSEDSSRFTSEDSSRFISEDSSRFTSEDSLRSSPFTVMHENEVSSKISDYGNKNLSPNQSDKSHSFAKEKVTVAKSSTTSTLASPNMPTKCFVGGVQRRKKKDSDLLETSFMSTANMLKEYILEKKENKENDSSADEHLAKFIISRLNHLPEEKRDEKRQKLIEILLSK